MPELHVPSHDALAVRISASVALALTMPLAELAPRFPGIDPWLAQLPARLGKAARADIRLLCVPLSGVLSYLFEAHGDQETIEPALDALAAASPQEVRQRALARLALHTRQDDPAELDRWIRHEPDKVRALIAAMESPNPDEAFAVDAERAVALLQRPAELKSMAEFRLRQLWIDHYGPRWREALPTCHALAEGARRRFPLGDPERVLTAIIGRKAQDHWVYLAGKRLVFVPVPFLGPYVAHATWGTYPVAFIGFGLVQGEGASLADAGAQGRAQDVPLVETMRDLLAVLRALADEPRMRAIAHIREHGEARAADFMQLFGWSQPATSRHLRALESTGILRAERIDGVKRYTIDQARAQAVVRMLARFLGEE